MGRSKPMDMHKQEGRMGRTGDGGSRRIVSVGLPDPRAGVGQALRSTFHVIDLPPDMLALLKAMDRH